MGQRGARQQGRGVPVGAHMGRRQEGDRIESWVPMDFEEQQVGSPLASQQLWAWKILSAHSLRSWIISTLCWGT